MRIECEKNQRARDHLVAGDRKAACAARGALTKDEEQEMADKDQNRRGLLRKAAALSGMASAARWAGAAAADTYPDHAIRLIIRIRPAARGISWPHDRRPAWARRWVRPSSTTTGPAARR